MTSQSTPARRSTTRPHSPHAQRTGHISRKPPSLIGKRILIVEDDSFLALDLVDRVQALGAETADIAHTDAAAVARIKRAQPDLALLDANLDGEFSKNTAEALLTRGIPFMFVTGYRQSTLPVPFSHLPVLLKPFTEDELHSALNTLLQKPCA